MVSGGGGAPAEQRAVAWRGVHNKASHGVGVTTHGVMSERREGHLLDVPFLYGSNFTSTFRRYVRGYNSSQSSASSSALTWIKDLQRFDPHPWVLSHQVQLYTSKNMS